MKIIYDGTQSTYRIKCRYCLSTIEFEFKDQMQKDVYNPYRLMMRWDKESFIICPVCKQEIITRYTSYYDGSDQIYYQEINNIRR